MTYKEAMKKLGTKTKGMEALDLTEEMETFESFLKDMESLKTEHEALKSKLKLAEDDINKRDGIIKESKKKDALQVALNSAEFDPAFRKGVEAILGGMLKEVDSEFVIDGKNPKEYVTSWVKGDGKAYLQSKPSSGVSDIPASTGVKKTNTPGSAGNSIESSFLRILQTQTAAK